MTELRGRRSRMHRRRTGRAELHTVDGPPRRPPRMPWSVGTCRAAARRRRTGPTTRRRDPIAPARPRRGDVDAAFDGELAALLALAGATGRRGRGRPDPDPGHGHRTAGRRRRARPGRATTARRPSSCAARPGAAARALAGTDHAVTTLSWPGAGRRRRDAPRARCWAPTPSPSTRAPGAAHRCAGSTSSPTDAEEAEAALRRATAVATAVTTARDLVNTPPNDLFPADLRRRAPRRWARPPGWRSRCSTRRRSRRAGTAASSASAAARRASPGWCGCAGPGGPAPRATVALVGKGITFDTGGISIKPAAHMDQMKLGHGRRGRRGGDDGARRAARAAGDGHRDRADGREHAVGDGVPARRRAAACTAAGPSRCSTPTPRAG